MTCAHVGCWQVFSLRGEFRRSLGGVGRDAGRLLHPGGACADRYGNVFVADRDNQRVQMFDRSGRYIASVLDLDTGRSSRVTAAGDVRPVDVAVTSQTRLVVLLAAVEGVDVPAEVLLP